MLFAKLRRSTESRQLVLHHAAGDDAKPPTLLSRQVGSHAANAAGEDPEDQKPAALPAGWNLLQDVATGETSWERPSADARANDATHILGCELSPDDRGVDRTLRSAL